jgi:hypothetical protein
MLIPVTAAVWIKAFFIDECFVSLVPFDEADDPVVPFIYCPDQVKLTHNAPQFYSGLTLRPRSKPYFAHPLNMHQAALKDGLFAYFAHGLEQCLMSIAGNAFDLDAKLEQIFQIFLKLFVPFTIGQPIKLGELDRVVPIEDQAQVVVKISAVDQKVDTLRGVNAENRWLGQTSMQIADQCPCRIAALQANLLDRLFANYPIFKPYKLVFITYTRVLPDEK